MLKILFLKTSVFFSILAFGQQKLQTTALNRFTIYNNDTTCIFYARMPEKKDKISKGHFYYWYNGERILSTQEGFSGRILHGKYTVFYPGKSMKEDGSFFRGLRTGIWKTWSPEGTLLTKYKWKKGKQGKKISLFTKKIKKKKVKRLKTPRKQKPKTPKNPNDTQKG